MKFLKIRSCVWVLVLVLMIPAGGFAQDTGSEQPPVFQQAELDQMLAPIALYPDPLLVQVLMAATYPLEVVQAARWVNQNPDLKDESLAAALDQKPWDPSVKSLVNFPSVLAMMNDNLEWTQNLGDAFLGQKDQVMATIQDLRAKAEAEGTLKSTNQQVVEVRENTIVIEPVNPEVVYVPVYNPTVVYGPWWYPDYPPYYYHPPGYAIVSPGIISFGVGIGLGVAWGYAWGNVNWSHHHVYVNPSQNIRINKYYREHSRYNHNSYYPGHDRKEWRHDPIHRKGVEYRDPGMRQQYGHGGSHGTGARKDFKGSNPYRDGGVPVNRQSGERKNDNLHPDRSTAPQNKPSGVIDNMNRNTNVLKKQGGHGTGTSGAIPANRGNSRSTGGREATPNISGSGRNSGTSGNIPANRGVSRSTGGREATPNVSGSGRSTGGGTMPGFGGNRNTGGGATPSIGGGSRSTGGTTPSIGGGGRNTGGGAIPNTGGGGHGAGGSTSIPSNRGGHRAPEEVVPSTGGGAPPSGGISRGGHRQQ